VPPLADLLSHLKELKSPLVIGHENADPDAVASAYGLSRLLDAPIGFPEDISREGKVLLRYLDVPYELNPNVEGKDVVVVDTSTREMLGRIDLERAESVTVIDHHASKPDIQGKLYIFPEFSSTSEIVYNLLRESGLALDEKLRIALVAGILFDTKNLYLASSQTLFTVAELLGDKTMQDILEVLSFEVDVTERIARLKALRKGEVIRIGDFLIVYVDAGSFEGSVASVLVTAGADIAIAYSSSSSLDRVSVRLSKRAIEKGFDAVELLHNLTDFGASCGGHKGAAGCKLPPKTAEKAVDFLVDKILESMGGDVRAFGVRRY